MTVTYSIKSMKNTHKYNIDGIEKRPRIDQEDRMSLLLQIIARNPLIPHTHVIKIAQYLTDIAKRTIEKELNRLESEGLLRSQKVGTSTNSPRLWEIPPPEIPEEKKAKKLLKELIDGMEVNVIKMESQYPQMDLVYRPVFLHHLFNSVSGTEFLFVSTEWFIDVSKERQRFNDLKQRCEKLLQNDKQFDKVFSMISSRIIPETMTSINLLTKNLK